MIDISNKSIQLMKYRGSCHKVYKLFENMYNIGQKKTELFFIKIVQFFYFFWHKFWWNFNGLEAHIGSDYFLGLLLSKFP